MAKFRTVADLKPDDHLLYQQDLSEHLLPVYAPDKTTGEPVLVKGKLRDVYQEIQEAAKGTSYKDILAKVEAGDLSALPDSTGVKYLDTSGLPDSINGAYQDSKVAQYVLKKAAATDSTADKKDSSDVKDKAVSNETPKSNEGVSTESPK